MTGLELPPACYLLIGALVLPCLPRKMQPSVFQLFALLGLASIALWPADAVVKVPFLQYELVLCRVDAVSRMFGVIFAFIALIGGIYSYHLRETGHHVAALLYAAGALGITFAGDFFTLLVFWELMAFASTYLIWARRTPEAEAAGMRYLLVHLLGGSFLLAGIAWQVVAIGDLSLQSFEPSASGPAWLILIGVGINAAIPPLHAWLADAYPKATIAGAVFLCSLTTKSAVLVLLRLFPGWDLLIYLGLLMTFYGTIYGLLVNDIRAILAYSTISQVGYMVAGIGIGTTLALNGTMTHAFCHILYKALLFMAAGAVLQATGRSRLSELGGLSRALPWTLGFYLVGALSISGVPLLNGFISKSMIISAAGEEHLVAVQLGLLLASIGTFLHTGLRLPYYTFFHRERQPRPAAALPVNMPAAMGVLSLSCVLIGVWPQLLYRGLPDGLDWHPYTLPHVTESFQLLALAFIGFLWLKPYLAGRSVQTLDTDWFYRWPAPWFRSGVVGTVNTLFSLCQQHTDRLVARVARLSRNPLQIWAGSTNDLERFDPDRNRFPLRRSMALTVLVAVAVALWGILWH